MTGFADYANYDAVGLAELVAKKKTSAVELVDSAIEAIESRNDELNAVVYESFERAREQAAGPLPDGPFTGVPFLLKDLNNGREAGQPYAAGSRSLRDNIADTDGEMASRFKSTGVVVVGRTNTPEFGLSATTEPELHGPTRNPYDTSRSPGGSSGGSGAAVAARFVPMAHASDGGGSIRHPASHCGLFGLKPSRGRMPVGPGAPWGWYGFSIDHVLSRSVRDSATMLDAVNGAHQGAPFMAPPPTVSYAEAAASPPEPLRIAFSTEPMLGDEMDRDCRVAVRQAAGLCEELGHEVTEVAPKLDKAGLTKAYALLICADTAVTVKQTEQLTGRKPRQDDFEKQTWLLHLIGKSMSASQLQESLETAYESHRLMAAFHENYDVLITSTFSKPPWKLGEMDLAGWEKILLDVVAKAPVKPILDVILGQMSGRGLGPIPNTPIFNMTGQPAMSVPLNWNAHGLPVGVQFSARYAEEETLFALAGQLEEAQPWGARRPLP